MTVRLLHGHERSDDRARADDVPSVLAVSERYSVDELHAVASCSGRTGFPGVPVDDRPAAVATRARGRRPTPCSGRSSRAVSISATTHTPIAPHVSLFAVVLDPEVTCSVQRYRPGELSSRNGFVLEGLLVDETSPAPNVVELAASDARDFDRWLTDATGWSPAAALRTEVRQITRTAQKIRSLFGALAADVPTTLEDQRVVDAGRAVTYRRQRERGRRRRPRVDHDARHGLGVPQRVRPPRRLRAQRRGRHAPGHHRVRAHPRGPSIGRGPWSRSQRPDGAP